MLILTTALPKIKTLLLLLAFCLFLQSCSGPAISKIEISIQALNRDASQALEKGDYLKARLSARTAYEKAQKYVYPEQELYARMYLGSVSYHLGNLKKARATFQEVENLLSLKETGPPLLHFQNLINLARVTLDLSKNKPGQVLPSVLAKQLLLAEKLLGTVSDEKEKNAAKLNSLKVQILIHQKKYALAKVKLLELQTSYEKYSDKIGQATAEGDFAEILRRENKPALALPHLEKALTLVKSAEHSPGIAFFLAEASQLRTVLADREKISEKRHAYLRQATWERLQCAGINEALRNQERLAKDYTALSELYGALALASGNKAFRKKQTAYKILAARIQKARRQQ